MNRFIITVCIGAAFGYAFAAGADDEKPNDEANRRRAAAADAEGRGSERARDNGRNAPREGDAAARGRRDDAPADRGTRRGENVAADRAGRGLPVAAYRERLRAEVNQRMRGVEGQGDAGRMQQEDPEMFALVKADAEMEAQTRQLVDQYHRASSDADREQIRGKLTAVVDNHFAVRQQRRELEVKRLEAQLERLRNGLKKRAEERQKLIDDHLAHLLGGDEAGF